MRDVLSPYQARAVNAIARMIVIFQRSKIDKNRQKFLAGHQISAFDMRASMRCMRRTKRIQPQNWKCVN